jgi:hypothetical protein
MLVCVEPGEEERSAVSGSNQTICSLFKTDTAEAVVNVSRQMLHRMDRNETRLCSERVRLVGDNKVHIHARIEVFLYWRCDGGWSGYAEVSIWMRGGKDYIVLRCCSTVWRCTCTCSICMIALLERSVPMSARVQVWRKERIVLDWIGLCCGSAV